MTPTVRIGRDELLALAYGGTVCRTDATIEAGRSFPRADVLRALNGNAQVERLLAENAELRIKAGKPNA